MDHLASLRAFRHAVELGGFSAAARKLGLSPAAISKSIGELERHLSVRLLHRTTRRMHLTEAGQRYYSSIRNVLDGLEEAERALDPCHDGPRGLLRIAAPSTLMGFLPEIIPAFLKRYPDVSIDLELSDHRVDVIGDGFDLAIRGRDNLGDSSLIARKLMTLKHVVCASPAYYETYGRPLLPEDLRGHDCIRFTASGHINEWRFTKGANDVIIEVSGRYRVSSSVAVRHALSAGFGISLIPELYVRDDLASGALQSVLSDWSPVRTEVYVVYPSRQYLPAKVRAFIDFLFSNLEQFQ